MLFPQLIDGPIVRYSTVEKELKKESILHLNFQMALEDL